VAGLDFAAIRAAHERIRPYIHRTPVLTSLRLNTANGASLFFKCENFQKGWRVLRARGRDPTPCSRSTKTAAQRGVATHSSGNHAAALARSCDLAGEIPAHIVMPKKFGREGEDQRGSKAYGGQIVFCEPTQKARGRKTCAELVARTGAYTYSLVRERNTFMAGQGTAALELIEDV